MSALHNTTLCKGPNCRSVDGKDHSLECHATHAASIAGGHFVKDAAKLHEIPAEILAIARRLRTQDNHHTKDALFVVQQVKSYITDEDYDHDRIEWREATSGEYSLASPLRTKRLELLYRDRYEKSKGWERFVMSDHWEFVTACFTEQGCKNYIDRNGHNLNQPRMYVDSAYRNFEFQDVRNWLMSLGLEQDKVAA